MGLAGLYLFNDGQYELLCNIYRARCTTGYEAVTGRGVPLCMRVLQGAVYTVYEAVTGRDVP